MGLEEYIIAGAALKRNTITLETDENMSGSVELGSSYVLLNVATNTPCRVRLYDTEASVNDETEKNRAFNNTNIAASTALVLDMSMSLANTYTIDPIVYGVPEDYTTYYRVDDAPVGEFPSFTFNTYTIEDAEISIENRKTLPRITTTLASLQSSSGTLTGVGVPKTYLLVSASVIGSTVSTRLRLYTTASALTNTAEINRLFQDEPAENSGLVVDAIMSSDEVTYFVPKIVGANLNTMGNNLLTTRTDKNKLAGVNEVYYIVQNLSAETKTFSVDVHVFELEK